MDPDEVLRLKQRAMILKYWQKKHGLTTLETADLLGLKSYQQVYNKIGGIDSMTEKDYILMNLWDVIFPMIQREIDRFYRGEIEVEFSGDAGELDGGIEAVSIARELAKGAKNITEALERALT